MMIPTSLLKVLRGSNASYCKLSRIRKCCMSTGIGRTKNITVCIEGNIGSGKTTFLEHFRTMDKHVEVMEEPLAIWREFAGYKPLETLYADPKRWAFTFQSLVLLTLVKQHTTPQMKPVRVMERSIFSARNCFVENLLQRKELSHLEYMVLDQWFQQCVTQHAINVDLIVYLKTKPETCLERIQNRQRPEERNVSLQYLKDLHQLHEDWLIKGDHSDNHRPHVLVLDANREEGEMDQAFQQARAHIHHYQHTPDTYHTSDPSVITIHS